MAWGFPEGIAFETALADFYSHNSWSWQRLILFKEMRWTMHESIGDHAALQAYQGLASVLIREPLHYTSTLGSS